MRKPTGLDLIILKVLYDTKKKSGDVIELLKDRKPPYDRVRILDACERLHDSGYINYPLETRTRGHADATLTEFGEDYIEDLW